MVNRQLSNELNFTSFIIIIIIIIMPTASLAKTFKSILALMSCAWYEAVHVGFQFVLAYSFGRHNSRYFSVDCFAAAILFSWTRSHLPLDSGLCLLSSMYFFITQPSIKKINLLIKISIILYKIQCKIYNITLIIILYLKW